MILTGITIGLIASVAYWLGKDDQEPIIITAYPSSIEMNLDDLIVESDLIVVGEFVNRHPSRWSTETGKLPDDATVETVSKMRLTIFTDTDFQVSSYLKGDAGLSVLPIRTFGGQVGNDSVIVSGEPSYKIGQEYLLFLFRNIGKTASIDPGSYYGVGSPFEIVASGQAVSADDEWFLEDLISYIELRLSGETPPSDDVVVEDPTPFTTTPTFTLTLTELLTETPLPEETPTVMP